MLAILGAIAARPWLVGIVTALAWGGIQHHKATAAGARALAAEKALADLRADAAQLALQTAARTAATHQGIAHDAQDKAARDRADAVAAGAALRRLRDSAAAAAGGAGACSAAAAGSAPERTIPVVPAQLFERLGAAAVELAAEADRYRVAGEACQRAYDALRPQP